MAVIMISFNEAHNMEAVLDNLEGWAQEVFLIDSYSTDETVDIALRRGVHVVQRRFRGFGDQWNFALENLPITAPWTMKLDPDERISNGLKKEIVESVTKSGDFDGFEVPIALFFMGKRIGARINILRLWKTGKAFVNKVDVNEHVEVRGSVSRLKHEIYHMDSPNLHHWYEKQNRYTTLEAKMRFEGAKLAAPPRLFGNTLERRMWLKGIRHRLPFRNLLMFLYCYVLQGAWRAGKVGWHWAHLRADVYRMIDLKAEEMKRLGKSYAPPRPPLGNPHSGAIQADEN